MKLRVSVPAEVELTDKQAKEVTIAFLRKHYDIPDRCFTYGTNPEMLRISTTIGLGHHSEVEDDEYRVMKDIDKAVWKVLINLRG